MCLIFTSIFCLAFPSSDIGNYENYSYCHDVIDNYCSCVKVTCKIFLTIFQFFGPCVVFYIVRFCDFSSSKFEDDKEFIVLSEDSLG